MATFKPHPAHRHHYTKNFEEAIEGAKKYKTDCWIMRSADEYYITIVGEYDHWSRIMDVVAEIKIVHQITVFPH